MSGIHVPEGWTAEQADLVFMFLARLSDAVWETYDADLVEIAIAETSAPTPPRLDDTSSSSPGHD